jgi:hypothetical protein
MSSAATSSLRRLLFISPAGHDGRKKERYVRFRLNCERLLELGLHSRPWIQHLIGGLDWGLLGCYIKKKKRLYS